MIGVVACGSPAMSRTQILSYIVCWYQDNSPSWLKQQELTEPSCPWFKVTGPRLRNSPVFTSHIFKLLSQDAVHKYRPSDVKQQSEIALLCPLKHENTPTEVL